MTGRPKKNGAVALAVTRATLPADGAPILAFPAAVARDEAPHRSDDPEVVAFRQKLGELTERELEVLEAVVAGHSSKVIAFRFGISPRTVQVHRAHIATKLGVRGLCNLVRLALVAGVGTDRERR